MALLAERADAAGGSVEQLAHRSWHSEVGMARWNPSIVITPPPCLPLSARIDQPPTYKIICVAEHEEGDLFFWTHWPRLRILWIVGVDKVYPPMSVRDATIWASPSAVAQQRFRHPSKLLLLHRICVFARAFAFALALALCILAIAVSVCRLFHCRASSAVAILQLKWRRENMNEVKRAIYTPTNGPSEKGSAGGCCACTPIFTQRPPTTPDGLFADHGRTDFNCMGYGLET